MVEDVGPNIKAEALAMNMFLKTKALKTYAASAALAVGLGGGFSAGTAAWADNVTDAMIGAYNSSGLLQQNRALLRAADETVGITLAGLRPIITSALAISRDYDRDGDVDGSSSSDTSTYATGSLSLSWLLFDNGVQRISTAAAQENVLATREGLVDIEQQVLFAAVEAYVNVLTQQDNVSLRQNNLRLLQEELRAANDRFEVGEVTRTDVALAQSSVAEARANLINAQGSLATARAVYAEVVGREPGAITSYPPLPLRSGGVDNARQTALRTHPGLKSQQHAVKAADLTAYASLRDLGPDLTLSATASQTELRGSRTDSSDVDVDLTLSQTLYSGGSGAALRRQNLAQVDAQKGALISTQRSIVQAVVSAYSTFEAAEASLVSSNEQVRAAQVAFDGIREEATLGSRTTLDVLEAEQSLLDAQTARLQARASQALAAYSLLQAQGLLTAENLNLAVETYDPEVYYNQVKSAPAFVSKRGQDLDRVLKALNKK